MIDASMGHAGRGSRALADDAAMSIALRVRRNDCYEAVQMFWETPCVSEADEALAECRAAD